MGDWTIMDRIKWLVTLMSLVMWSDHGRRRATATPQVSALWVFGDSLVDNGNNNYLSSLAKANFYPYGIDSIRGPTGRFSNGKNVIDYLGTYHLIIFSSSLSLSLYTPTLKLYYSLILYISNIKINYLHAADLLNVPSPPPFADPSTSGVRLIGGVNYASAAAGILDESGQHYV